MNKTAVRDQSGTNTGTDTAIKTANDNAEALEAPLAEEEGWQIARASFVREATHYSLKGGTALLLLAAVVFGIFWAVNQVVNMPPHVVKNVQDFVAPVTKMLPGQNKVEPVKTEAVKPTPAVSTPRARAVRHSSNTYKPRKKTVNRPGHGYVRSVRPGDEPTGGRVTYSDGMITEYSWNK